MSEWIEWKGGERPVDSMTYVEVKFRDGEVFRGNANLWIWRHEFEEDDIIAYRVVKEKEAC